MSVRASSLLGLLLWVAVTPRVALAERPAAPAVGLLAAAEPRITASLAAGARLALAEWERRTGLRLELEVAERADGWSAASGPAVEMAFESRVVALVTPPERAAAHLLAQLGSRAHLPVVSTSGEPSVTATGSFWVVSVAPNEPPGGVRPAFREAFRAAEGSEPDSWAALGYDAAAAVAAAVDRGGLDRRAVVEAWRGGLSVAGSAGRFAFDASGRRGSPRADARYGTAEEDR